MNTKTVPAIGDWAAFVVQEDARGFMACHVGRVVQVTTLPGVETLIVIQPKEYRVWHPDALDEGRDLPASRGLLCFDIDEMVRTWN